MKAGWDGAGWIEAGWLERGSIEKGADRSGVEYGNVGPDIRYALRNWGSRRDLRLGSRYYEAMGIGESPLRIFSVTR